MGWLFLLAAGCVEVAFALSIEPTKGFTRPLQTGLCFVLGAGSIYLLTHALKTLPIGTAYAVFTGIGAVGGIRPGSRSPFYRLSRLLPRGRRDERRPGRRGRACRG